MKIEMLRAWMNGTWSVCDYDIPDDIDLSDEIAVQKAGEAAVLEKLPPTANMALCAVYSIQEDQIDELVQDLEVLALRLIDDGQMQEFQEIFGSNNPDFDLETLTETQIKYIHKKYAK